MQPDVLPQEIKAESRWRLRLLVKGAVQGLGFRPFVYRLASQLELGGWILNTPQGVIIEAEGPNHRLEEFVRKLKQEKPPQANIESLEASYLGITGYKTFEIRASLHNGKKTAEIAPDLAVCEACVAEIFDPNNRRYLYPFTNCTHCGPRFSIVESLPYDRANTSMKNFAMCVRCREEYENPLNRRFHAQPNACPDCGPHLELLDSGGKLLALRGEAMKQAADSVRDGRIVAVKGIGGFQLIADARQWRAVAELRRRKHREEKPFALMFPDLQSVMRECDVSSQERELLLSPQAPIVLLRRKLGLISALAAAVAPGNPNLGVMLPYSPMHAILMKELGFPIIATSGNLSEEPICIDEHQALARLAGIADVFLVHDRPVVRPLDDSVVRIMASEPVVVRRARGYAPRPIALHEPAIGALAVGGHLKNTVAVTTDSSIVMSQHIGDLESETGMEAFRKTIDDLKRLYQTAPVFIAGDVHPDYLSTQYARSSGISLEPVQHHHAHMVSCMAEHNLPGPILGVIWDGSGFGPDGTIWGGEFLLGDASKFRRVAHLRTFPLPGGEKAVREPRRAALGMLYEIFGEEAFEKILPPLETFSPAELRVFGQMFANDLNVPRTSSAGRLFDAVASLLGLRQRMSFEGQAAMDLEFEAEKEKTETFYLFGYLNHSDSIIVDWEPALRGILDDFGRGETASRIAAKFHNTLAEIIAAVVRRLGEKEVVLSGGCFQNKYLLERTIARLDEDKVISHFQRQVPCNDGGLALGQIVAGLHRRKEAR